MYTSKISNLFIAVLYFIAILTVILTVYFPSDPTILSRMTKENSFFESSSALLLLFITLYGLLTVYSHRSKLSISVTVGITFFSILCFLASMEEISWGQHIFHFESSEYFLKENLQQETNFHNLMEPTLFSSLVNTFVYNIFIYLPLLLKIFPILKNKFNFLKYFDIHSHTVLIALFSSIFIAFFYEDIGVLRDSIAHVFGLIFFLIYIIKENTTTWVKIHYIFILISTVFSMSSYHVYSFNNMQYEIREMFIVLASLLIFIELIQRYKLSQSIK